MVLAVQSLRGRSDTFKVLADMHEPFRQCAHHLDRVGYDAHTDTCHCLRRQHERQRALHECHGGLVRSRSVGVLASTRGVRRRPVRTGRAPSTRHRAVAWKKKVGSAIARVCAEARSARTERERVRGRSHIGSAADCHSEAEVRYVALGRSSGDRKKS